MISVSHWGLYPYTDIDATIADLQAAYIAGYREWRKSVTPSKTFWVLI